ncbi:hypothetical protein BATDEDRAFT_92219 [Batrachochytrium dendrobatidis JAM81]|uniref:Uncharacterized protein n=1 Tax=Batrachochytrium dendrobatidis (strain JAM81 / FGSC 10211) TaxID=684364 RepID=F4PD23_BATDJ|nr:uncharacterized protein BATDEDRAFT_92219 [Batrachochytrium dendrobatidis JAM81]EGF77018.1 hypothetical protein BATDEDRAFT_92219 [Batrachochytrium dendrobatidis JAM81]|eukprot:XP_006682542.1 hypothetical protein BATDEDRAFT_92219 [Batrachochytrium dendrobatidis JAM81]
MAFPLYAWMPSLTPQTTARIGWYKDCIPKSTSDQLNDIHNLFTHQQEQLWEPAIPLGVEMAIDATHINKSASNRDGSDRNHGHAMNMDNSVRTEELVEDVNDRYLSYDTELEEFEADLDYPSIHSDDQQMHAMSQMTSTLSAYSNVEILDGLLDDMIANDSEWTYAGHHLMHDTKTEVVEDLLDEDVDVTDVEAYRDRVWHQDN